MSEELTVEQIAEKEAAELKEKQAKEKAVKEKAATKAEQLRELSKEYGFDAFKPEEVKSKLAEFKAFQDSQKTEQEKLQAELDTLKKNENTHKAEKEKYEGQIAGLELGIPKEKLNDALVLAKNSLSDGQTIKDGLKAIQEKYKDTFKQNSGVTLQVGSQMGNEDPNNNKPIEPALARYIAKQEKAKKMRNK